MVKECTHSCPACGTGHYAEYDNDFYSRCRGCGYIVRLQRDTETSEKVVVQG